MKKIKLLFLYPNAVMQNPPPVSIALFYAMLKDIKNLEIKLFDTTLYNIEEKTSDKVKEENLQVKPFNFEERGIYLLNSDIYSDFQNFVYSYEPDIIALSCNEITYNLGKKLIEKIIDYKCLRIIGGVFPTFAPEKIFDTDLFDFVCIGEGEETLVELITNLIENNDIYSIHNLAYKKNNKIIKNNLRSPILFENLPLPDYDIFDWKRYYRPMAGKVWRVFPIETSRGCPYNCSYCNSPSTKQLYKKYGYNNYFRKKSIEIINDELNYLKEKYNPEYIYFLSDTLLCMSDNEFDEFCNIYEKIKLPFWCQNRPEMITYNRLKRLKDIGCHRMSIGVEHGNENFRKTVLNKNVSNKTIYEAFEIIEKVGIPVTVNNIIGFPGETIDLAMDTVNMNKKLNFDSTNAYAFTPFHGTELYAVCKNEGFIHGNENMECLTKGTILDMPQFSKTEIDNLIKNFVLKVKG